MGLQPRNPVSRLPGSDLEKAPLVEQEDELLKGHGADSPVRFFNRRIRLVIDALLLFGVSTFLYASLFGFEFPFPGKSPSPLPDFVVEGMKQCEVIARPPPNPKPNTEKRTKSDRFVEGTKGVWLKNATVWTGEKDGQEVLHGVGLLLEGGVIRKIGEDKDLAPLVKDKDVDVVELDGAWVTPGIVDMHSHLAVDSAPHLSGSDDTNSLKDAVLPWLRSLDAFNTHDSAFNLSIAGGITTMLVLPGSAGNIGGQAFTFKPRWTYENTPQSMQVDPPFVISSKGNGSWERTAAWRHMKHACGENAHNVYGNTRLDSAWDFRRAYNEGQKLKEKQERWCAAPKDQKEPFPTDLQWEVMADIIRGNVKVVSLSHCTWLMGLNIHCYETVDLNDLVRISNEFQFPIAAFHHAHETYLVTDLLKQAWGPVPPSVAIFATNARYKREAYRGSEFAPKILADSGLNVCMKSDHPVLDSRYLVFEAAQAHHYGLNFSHAMGSVTTHPAKAVGLDHRLGYIRPGYDADVVVWDSFPLYLGATPKQTYIDGIPQIVNPHPLSKGPEEQEIIPAGKYDKEAKEALDSRGDPDLRPKKSMKSVIFEGVNSVYLPGKVASLSAEDGDRVVSENGEITCIGQCAVSDDIDFEVVDLKGGSITPGFITVGSYVGLREITQEKTTRDGKAYDPLTSSSDIVDGVVVRAVDGARFEQKDELLAYRAGVTTGVTAPIPSGLFAGISYSFSTGAETSLSDNAILNPAVAFHISMSSGDLKISISSQIAILRRLLQGDMDDETELTKAMEDVAKGDLRLVVHVTDADIMAAMVRLKKEVAPAMKMTFLGGAESWMLAEELAKEQIGVIVSPARSFPFDWDSRRIIPGPPLSNHTLPSYLASHGVKVGLGIMEEWQARNTRFDAAWAYSDSPDVFSKNQALDLISSNLEELLGMNDKYRPGVKAEGATVAEEEVMERKEGDKSWVAWEGDVFTFEGRVKGVRSFGAGQVDMF